MTHIEAVFGAFIQSPFSDHQGPEDLEIEEQINTIFTLKEPDFLYFLKDLQSLCS